MSNQRRSKCVERPGYAGTRWWSGAIEDDPPQKTLSRPNISAHHGQNTANASGHFQRQKLGETAKYQNGQTHTDMGWSFSSQDYSPANITYLQMRKRSNGQVFEWQQCLPIDTKHFMTFEYFLSKCQFFLQLDIP